MDLREGANGFHFKHDVLRPHFATKDDTVKRMRQERWKIRNVRATGMESKTNSDMEIRKEVLYGGVR